MPDNHSSRALEECIPAAETGYRELAPVLYRRLRELAAGSLRRERRDHTLQPTALANEAFLRLSQQRSDLWNDPARFAALAGRIMRRILVDHARSRNRAKRGAGARQFSLDETLVVDFRTSNQIVEVGESLRGLASVAPRAAKVVELRFFAGLSNAEAATLLGVTQRSIERDWRFAKAWLYRALRGEPALKARSGNAE